MGGESTRNSRSTVVVGNVSRSKYLLTDRPRKLSSYNCLVTRHIGI
jgi:hypothetical protein